MNTLNLRLAMVLYALALSVMTTAQNDGDYFQSSLLGPTIMGPDLMLPGGSPTTVTLGTTAFTGAFFNIRADQMPLTANWQDRIFETRGDANRQSIWAMYRDTDPIGRLFCNQAAANRGFNIQALQFRGSTHLRTLNGKPTNTNVPNASGLRLVDDTVAYDGFAWNGYPNLPRVGYVGIGHSENTDLHGFPWSRLHLVHGLGAQVLGGGYLTTWQDVRGYRGWMRNGISLNGTGTSGYLGQKYSYNALAEVNDSTDMIAAWGDSTIAPGATKFDNFSFRFMTDPNVGATGSSSTAEGLEFMRMKPHRTTTGGIVQGFVGVGDWVNNAPALPSERLDMLNGRLRIRQLPNDPIASSLTKVLVVDDTPGPEFGVVKWKTITGGGLPDCDWLVDPTGSDVTTAWDPGALAGCPTHLWNVGVGTEDPIGKFHVLSDPVFDPSLDEVGVNVTMNGDDETAVGVFVSVNKNTPGGTWTKGVKANVYNGSDKNTALHGYVQLETGRGTTITENAGTLGEVWLNSITYNGVGARGYVRIEGGCDAVQAIGTWGSVELNPDGSTGLLKNAFGSYGRATTGQNRYGAYGFAENLTTSLPTKLIGVTGLATGLFDTQYGIRIGVHGIALPNGNPPLTPGTSWAGYFEGDVQTTGQQWNNLVHIFSDAAIKDNVQDITNASTLLAQLQPRTYQLDSAAVPQMAMDASTHLGFVAQEVQLVLPDLVRKTRVFGKTDSAGNVIHPSVDLLGVNYTEIIPLLVAGFQEQQVTIAAMQQQLAAQQAQLAACCVVNDGPLLQGTGNNGTTGTQDLSRAASGDQLTIVPNPFTGPTTITYRSNAHGRVQLRVTDGRGQHIDTLRDQQQDAGTYTYEWNTQGVAAGTYTVTLLLDGNRLVERVVKLGE